jgi:outer membrane protein assembly factor BamB
MRRGLKLVAGLVLVPAMMAGLALTGGPAHARVPVSGGSRHGLTEPTRVLDSSVVGQAPQHRHVRVTYFVRADIDGHSQLTLSGRTARWYHIGFAAPGRLDGKNDPTIINGARWYPTWPQPGENRDCGCYSSTFRKVVPRVPARAFLSSFQKVSCRDSCSARFSHGAVVIDFNDDPSGGDAWYKVRVTLTSESESQPVRAPTAPHVNLSVSSGPPTSTVTVSGHGFGAHRAVDLYFDTTDKALASTNRFGDIPSTAIQIPATSLPGTHYITAVQRRSGRSAQAKFLVNTNWAQDGFSVSHSGVNPYENVLSRANVAGLSLDWSYPVGSDGEADNEASPAVVNGIVYMSGAPPQISGSPSNLYALSEATGKRLWAFTFGGTSIGGTPAVVNGRIYIRIGPFLYALRAATGNIEWAFRTAGSLDWSPSVANRIVYIGAGDGKLYAVTAGNGEELWSFTTAGGIISSPTVANGVVYVGSGDGNIYALNAVTGVELWSFSTGASISYSNVAVATGVAYVANAEGNVYALNATSGAELWSFNAGAGIASPLAVANGVVYLDTSGPNGEVAALSAATGHQLWSFTTGGAIDSSSPAVANGVVYVGSTDDTVYALSATTGTELWRFPTGLAVESSPAVVNGRVYIGSDDGNLYAFGLPGAGELSLLDRPASLRPNYSLR